MFSLLFDLFGNGYLNLLLFWYSEFDVASPKKLLQSLIIIRHIKIFKPFLFFTGKYSNISDAALDGAVQEIQGHHPGVGIRMLTGHLKRQGLTVQRERVRQSLLRTDPSGVLQRWRDSIRRRVYSVPFPQALWHIDGNHKLIRYGSRFLIPSKKFHAY